MRRRWRFFIVRLLRSRHGASAVEFALVMPVFMLIMAGTLCYGLYFGAAHSVQQLAAEAARATIPGLTPVERALLAQASVSSALPNYAMIDADRIVVTVGTHESNANLFDVAVTYDASNMPIWMFEGLLPLPPKVIQRAAVVRRGGY